MKRKLFALLSICLLLLSAGAVMAQIEDTDRDGVAHNDDRCPRQAGPASNAGCPVADTGSSTGSDSGDTDTDGDSVPDSSDQCATIAGTADYGGCPGPTATPIPDSDADGEHDLIDQCLTEPGPAENRGCPLVDTTGGSIPSTATPAGPSNIAALPSLPDTDFCNVATATTEAVNLRAEPSLTSEILTSISPQDTFVVVSGIMSEGILWYRLEFVNDGWAGYVASSVMRGTEECASIEIFSLMPLPNDAKLDLSLTTPIEDTNTYTITLSEVMVSSVTNAPRNADGSVNPDLATCVYHPDYGFIICIPNPDGTVDPAARTLAPDERKPLPVNVCVYNPALGYIICHQAVEEGEGRIGEMSLLCTLNTNRCVGSIVTFPEESDETCPVVGLLLPAVQAAREAARRIPPPPSSSASFIDIDNLTSQLPEPDPCALVAYGLDLPMDQVALNFALPTPPEGTPRPGSLIIWDSPTFPTPPEGLNTPDDGSTAGHCSTGGGITGCSVGIGPFSISLWYESGSGVGGAACHNSSEGVQTCVP